MKKILIVCFAALMPLLLVGCGAKDERAVNFMSEVTKEYFYCSKNGESVSISVGKREEQYKMDGVHGKTVDFALISYCPQECLYQKIAVQLSVNGQISRVILTLNPFNSCYMADIGYALKEDDNIAIIYGDKTFDMKNLSKDFKISYKKAIEIGIKALDDQIKDHISGSFDGECYLKVLTKNGGDLYWVFTFVSRDGVFYNAAINISTGDVVVK